MQRISYITFFDGPCDVDSFKPEQNQSQHWGRRDALVRCTTMALYESSGFKSQVCDDCYFVFFGNNKRYINNNNNNSNNNSDNIDKEHYDGKDSSLPSVLLVDRLVSSSIPTEKSLIRKFKESAIVATSNNKKMKLLAMSMPCSNDDKLKNIKHDNIGVTCSYTPWIEAVLISQKVKRQIQFNNDNIINNKRQKKVIIPNQNFDKRTLLQIMQQQCSIEFLRKHSLNGSEQLILKKKNMSAIEKAFNEWNQINSNNHMNDNNNSKSDNDVSDNSSNGNNNNMIKDRLVDTLKVLLYRILKKLVQLNQDSEKIIITVLLLHENARSELGVFGSIEPDVRDKRDIHHTVAVMGGVRDMSTFEVECVIEATESMGFRCVGANLGKTAEFTSKIICALNAHAIYSNNLENAVRILPRLTKDDSKSLLLKDDLMKRSKIKSPLFLHVLLCVDFASTEVSASIEARPKMHQIIQALVCCLWRSRLAKEIMDEERQVEIVNTDLTFIFKDKVKITINQRSFLQTMASKHFSAPSEHQVITTFCDILQSSTPENDFHSVSSTLHSLLPCKELGDELFVVEIFQTMEAVCIADFVYSQDCFCNKDDDKVSSKYVYILLLNSDSKIHNDVDTESVLNIWKYGSKKGKKRNEKGKRSKILLKANLFSNYVNYSPGCIVTILLHWSYHGLLIPSIKMAIKQEL